LLVADPFPALFAKAGDNYLPGYATFVSLQSTNWDYTPHQETLFPLALEVSRQLSSQSPVEQALPDKPSCSLHTYENATLSKKDLRGQSNLLA
jgi:hypothetical protein